MYLLHVKSCSQNKLVRRKMARADHILLIGLSAMFFLASVWVASQTWTETRCPTGSVSVDAECYKVSNETVPAIENIQRNGAVQALFLASVGLSMLLAVWLDRRRRARMEQVLPASDDGV